VSYLLLYLSLLISDVHRTMPARQLGKFRCCCIICTASCDTGPDGTPLGKLIPESQRIPHLARVKAETEARRQSDIQSAAASLFASTLIDDGPDLHAQPSRLWSSREEYQSSASTISPKTQTHSMDIILDSFQRLQSEVQDSTPLQSVSFPPESEALPYPVIQESTSSTSKPSKYLPKRELNKLTKSAHRILDHIEKRTRHWLLQIDVDTLADGEHDMAYIQTAFDNVKRDVPSVNARKATIGTSLAQLQSRLVELRRLNPSVDDKPLQFDSSKLLFSGIDLNSELKTFSRPSL
jgi:hypothetical protein